MTVSSTNTKNSYSGNGSTTVFAYTFKIFDDDDISVILRTDATGGETVQTKGTHYSVSGVGNAGGGNITFVTAPASGITVVLIRATVQTQTTDYTPNDPFPAASHEEALDRLTLMVQDQQEELDRSIKVSRTNTISSTEFTIGASDRANKVFAFDGNGDFSVTQEIGTYKGTDATVTTSAYSARDIVKSTTAAQLGNVYIATQNSPAGTSLTNTTYWQLLIDAVAAATSAANAAASAVTAEGHADDSETAQAAAEAAQALAETAQTNAETAETNAQTAQTAAEAAQAAAEAAADNFDDIYLGAKASDPTVDNDGDALTAGDLYFNTTTNNLKIYTGSAWVDAALTAADFLTVANNLSDVASASTALSNLGGLPLAGGTMTGNINFGDSVKANFGAGSDLQIYHDGSNSYVVDAATGDLNIRSNGAKINLQTFGGTNMIEAINNGNVVLYSNGAERLRTNGTGVSVTGTAVATTDTDTTNTGNVGLQYSSNQNFVLTLTGNVTLTNTSSAGQGSVGQSGFIVFIQDATGGRTVSLGTDYETAGGAGITLSSAANTTDIVPYVIVATGRILLGAPQLAFA
jgi:hypothetical protein